MSLRLWQCRKVSVTELVDTNPSRKWSFKQHQCPLTKVWAPVNEAFKRFVLRCGTLLPQLQRKVGIELLPESGAMCREARSLAALQVSQEARHEPHAVRDGASEEIQQNTKSCFVVMRKLRIPQTWCSTKHIGHTLAERYLDWGATRKLMNTFQRYGRWHRASW